MRTYKTSMNLSSSSVTVFPLFSPRGAYLISNVFEGGLNRGRGLIKFLKFKAESLISKMIHKAFSLDQFYSFSGKLQKWEKFGM